MINKEVWHLRILLGSIRKRVLFLFGTSVNHGAFACVPGPVCEWVHGLQVHFLLTAKSLWILRSVWLVMVRSASFRLIQSRLKGGGKCVSVGLDSDDPCCCLLLWGYMEIEAFGTITFFHQTLCSLWTKQKKRFFLQQELFLFL